MAESRFTFRQKASLLWSVWRDKRAPWYIKAIPVVAVLYGVSPLDFIPDFIPVIGQLDDVLVIVSLLVAMYNLIPKDLYREKRERVKVKAE